MPHLDRRSEFLAFVEARYPQLRRLAYGLCGDWHDAEDVVQIAMAKLYVAWPRIHSQGREDAFARKVVLNAVIDQSRRTSRRERPGLEGYDHPARGSEPTDRHDLIVALAELSPMQRKTVVLRHWLGLSVTETADELGISEGTVKSHTSRALERLNQLMSVTEGTTP